MVDAFFYDFYDCAFTIDHNDAKGCKSSPDRIYHERYQECLDRRRMMRCRLIHENNFKDFLVTSFCLTLYSEEINMVSIVLGWKVMTMLTSSSV